MNFLLFVMHFGTLLIQKYYTLRLLFMVLASCNAFTSSIVISGTFHKVTYPSESPLSKNLCDFPLRDVVINFIAGGHESGYR